MTISFEAKIRVARIRTVADCRGSVPRVGSIFRFHCFVIPDFIVPDFDYIYIYAFVGAIVDPLGLCKMMDIASRLEANGGEFFS